jgi:hypothetical protein
VSNRTRAALSKQDHALLGIEFAGAVQAVAVDLESQTMSAVSHIARVVFPLGIER